MENNISKELMNRIYQNIQSDGIQKIVVGAVIDMGKNKPLLLKRTKTDFMGELVELPSGTVNPSETLEEALQREVLEETGLTIRKIDSFIGTFDYLSGSGKKTRQVNFKVEVQNNKVRLSHEHDAFYIYSPDSSEYQQLNISTATKNIIHQAFCTQNNYSTIQHIRLNKEMKDK